MNRHTTVLNIRVSSQASSCPLQHFIENHIILVAALNPRRKAKCLSGDKNSKTLSECTSRPKQSPAQLCPTQNIPQNPHHIRSPFPFHSKAIHRSYSIKRCDTAASHCFLLCPATRSCAGNKLIAVRPCIEPDRLTINRDFLGYCRN